MIADQDQYSFFEEAALFDSMHSLWDNKVDSASLHHHIYNESQKIWQRRRSDSQPVLSITVRAVPADAYDLGLPKPISKPTKALTVSFSAMTDTGCQSCLLGIKLSLKLGLNASDLAPTSMGMTAA